MISGYHQQVADHYEKYPYPHYPLFSIGRWRALDSVDVQSWGATRKIEDIWIAGCGTIAPLMFGRRNFRCRVFASDLSEKALKIAKRRLKLFGTRNVLLKFEDLIEANYRETFDAVDAYGVIHHTFAPQIALEKLARAVRPGGALRLMLYSEASRSEIETIRKETRLAKLDSVPVLKKFLKEKSVPMTGDLSHHSGIADALLNPIVHVYSEKAARELIDSVPSLEIVDFKRTSNFVIFCRKRASE